MPLSVNIGLSRKISRNFQSTGVSVNLNAELDSTLLTKPDELQGQIENLYGQAEQALNRQATKLEPTTGLQRHDDRRDSRAGRGNDRNGGGMTSSQRRAIGAIARGLNVDAHLEARDIIGAELEQLSIREASDLIDHLRRLQPSGNGRNVGDVGGGEVR